MARTVLRLLWGPAVLLVTLAVTVLVGTFSFAMGLIVGEPVLWWVGYPVASLMTGLAAALAATWTGNVLAPDRSRTQLWRVLAWTEAAAIAGVAVFLVLYLSRAMPSASLASMLLPLGLLVPVVASFATLRIRRPQDSLRRDAIASLLLLLLLPVGFYGVVGIACLVGMCGA